MLSTFASLPTFLAVWLLASLHMAQTHTDTDTELAVIFMAEVNVSGYGDALYSMFSGPVPGLYTYNVSAPLNARAGLRQLYGFGLYSHCAQVGKTFGLCTDKAFAYEFQPYAAITNDMLSNYSDYTDSILHNASFADSSSLGRGSRAAFYLLVLSLTFSSISFVTGPVDALREDSTWAPFVSALTAVMACIFVLAGSVIWTTLIKRAGDVNSWAVPPAQFPLGIKVSVGFGLELAWASFGLLVGSVIVHTISVTVLLGDGWSRHRVRYRPRRRSRFRPRVPRWLRPNRRLETDRQKEERQIRLAVQVERA